MSKSFLDSLSSSMANSDFPINRKIKYWSSSSSKTSIFLTLEEFGLILGLPIKGQCSFTDKWSLDYLEYSVPSNGPYQTTPPTPNDIKSYVQVEREEPITRIRYDQIINVEENQILTREITPIMKSWVEIIRENPFCLGGNWDHVTAFLCHMLYCIAKSKPYNLAFFVAKRMEWVSRQAGLILPYGMLLTRLFTYVMSIHPELFNDRFVLYDRVMNPLAIQHERKKRKDYGTKRGIHSTLTSFSSAFNHQSSSHHEDANENDEVTSRASIPSPIRFVDSLPDDIPQVFSNPLDDEQTMQNLFTRQIKILNRQVQL
ncbi:hypothetical protein Tco_0351463 [Tanacetum coccineum]